MDRNAWVNWEGACSLTMHDRIKVRLREILAQHEPPPMPAGVEDQIQAILTAAVERDRRTGG
jgi:trimethylamine:corrinoid methyltransferase-like protein